MMTRICIIVKRIILFLLFCGISTAIHANYRTVETYDLVLDNLIGIWIDGKKIEPRMKLQNSELSRIHIRLQIYDANQVKLITINNVPLTLDSGLIDFDVFLPDGYLPTIDLRVNNRYDLKIAAGISRTKKKSRKSYEKALQDLSRDPYDIKAYQLLIKQQKEKEIKVVRKKICSIIAESLTQTYQSGDLEGYGKGLNICAVYAGVKLGVLGSEEKLDQQVEMYDQILKISPLFAPAHLELAKIYYADGERNDFDSAIYHLTLATQKNYHNAFHLNIETQDLHNQMTQALREEIAPEQSLSEKSEYQLKFANLKYVLKHRSHSSVPSIRSAYQKAKAIADTETAHRIDFNLLLLDFEQDNWGENQKQALNQLLDQISKNNDLELKRAVYNLALVVTKNQQSQHIQWWLAQDSQARESTDIQDNEKTLLARALVYLNPADPRHLNNLACALAERKNLIAAKQRLFQALARSAQWKNGDSSARSRSYQKILGNLKKCYLEIGWDQVARELRSITNELRQHQ